jgi:signal transduction histidine kinase
MKDDYGYKEKKAFVVDFVWQQRDQTLEEIYPILQDCLNAALLYNDKEMECEVYSHLADYYIELKDFTAALEILEKGEKLYQSDQNLQSYKHILNKKIKNYNLIGDYEKSFRTSLNYIEYVKKDNNHKDIASAYSVLGITYKLMRNKEACLSAHLKAVEHINQTDDIRLTCFVYMNLAGDLEEYGELEQAEKYIILSNEYGKKIDFDFAIHLNNTNLAVIYRKQNKYQESEKLFLEGINFFESVDATDLVFQSKIEYAKLLFDTQRFLECIDLLNAVVDVVGDVLEKKVQCLALLHECYAKTNDFANAYPISIQYIQTEKLIHNEKSEQNIQNLEITHKVKQIEQEKKFAENMAKLKHDFLANMSHEIRTPINNIMGLSFLLQEEQEKNKQQQFALRIHKSAQNLLDLINDILDISKIEAGKFDLNEQIFSLPKLLDTIQSIVQYRTEEKGLIFVIENQVKGEFYYGDAIRIQQILINIIANAIKFTHKGSVQFKIYTNEINELIFSIKDTGIGIETNKLLTIFDAYEQASSSIKTTFGGTGLGLSIAKMLVDKMKGKISVDSESNKGTTFEIILPLNAIENNLSASNTKENNVLNIELLDNILIYCADDNEENRNVLIEILQHYNATIQVIAFENGQTLLDNLLQTSTLPNLIITDLDMPELNGFELIQAIRSTKKVSPIPVIATTSSLLLNETEDVLSLGFNALLQNPTPPQLLIETILEILSKSKV